MVTGELKIKIQKGRISILIAFLNQIQYIIVLT